MEETLEGAVLKQRIWDFFVQLWVTQKFSQVVTAGTAWPQTSLLWVFSTVDTQVPLQMVICFT